VIRLIQPTEHAINEPAGHSSSSAILLRQVLGRLRAGECQALRDLDVATAFLIGKRVEAIPVTVVAKRRRSGGLTHPMTY
jgi:hypothetical protein